MSMQKLINLTELIFAITVSKEMKMSEWYKVVSVFEGGVYFQAIKNGGPEEASKDERSWETKEPGYTFLKNKDNIKIKWPDDTVEDFACIVRNTEPNGSDGPYYHETTINKVVNGASVEINIYGLEIQLG